MAFLTKEAIMARPLIIPVGERFNRLTVLEFVEHRTMANGKKKAFVRCVCDCGQERLVGLGDLKSGATKTCGDFSNHPYPRKPLKNQPDDLVLGGIYGDLTVLAFIEYTEAPGGHRVPKVECACRCGETTVVSFWDLKAGKTLSCGGHPRYKDRSLPAFNTLYRHTYRGRALQKGLAFKLTEAEFRILTQRDCFYCGAKPRSKMVMSGKHQSEYMYNGIDRVDNSIGYIIGNVVPCCFDCNHAKATLSQEQFIALANRVAGLHPV